MASIGYSKLQELLDIIQAGSIRNVEFKSMKPISWPEYRANVVSFYNNDSQDIKTVIRHALKQLNDGHSYIPNNIDAPSKEFIPPQNHGRMIGTTAYVQMQSCDLMDVGYAQTLHDIIRDLDQSDPTGWIVDLRVNHGGDYGPMIAGIGPLLGNGLHAFVTRPHLYNIPDNTYLDTGCSYQDGTSFDNIHPRITVPNPYSLKHPKPPIAVLVGEGTDSSGEFTLVAFKKLENVKIFGTESCGDSSSNDIVPFEDRFFLLTSGIFQDREHVTYGSHISPDFYSASGADIEKIKQPDYAPAEDLLVQEAISWLTRQSKVQPAIDYNVRAL